MEAALPALAEREGAPRVALEAARHLSMCGGCAERLLRLRALHAMLDELPAAEVPASFARRVLRALPSKGKIGAGFAILIALMLAGGAASVSTPIGSLSSSISDPIEAATSALSAGLRLAFDLLALLQGTLGGVGSAVPRLEGPAFPPPPAPIVALAVFATLALAASGLAFGRGALRLLREQRAHR
jgi:hypothetical protein